MGINLSKTTNWFYHWKKINVFESPEKLQVIKQKHSSWKTLNSKLETMNRATWLIFYQLASFYMVLSTVAEKCKIFWKAKILTKLQK